jgi:pyruvate dehydrogenase E1 component alpha subunit
MHTVVVDGQDVEAVHDAALAARTHAVEGSGPVFLVANTYRLTGHYVGDPQVYRAREEIREVRQTHDPVAALRAELDVSDADWAELEHEIAAIVEGAVEFAVNGTDPQPEDAMKNIYA